MKVAIETDVAYLPATIHSKKTVYEVKFLPMDNQRSHHLSEAV
jgi:hypothetical protein